MKNLIFLLISLNCLSVFSQKIYMDILSSIDDKKMKYETTAKSIWNLAEIGFQENESSAILQEILRASNK